MTVVEGDITAADEASVDEASADEALTDEELETIPNNLGTGTCKIFIEFKEHDPGGVHVSREGRD